MPTHGIVLGSADDQDSFFVPSYGFPHAYTASQYRDTPSFCTENCLPSPHAAFTTEGTRFATFVPRVNATENSWLASKLDRGGPEYARPSWVTLLAQHRTLPKDAYNIALVVEGFRLNRASYAAWSRCDGKKLERSFWNTCEPAIYPIRSGRGILYTRKHLLGKGVADRILTTVTGLTFSIFDRAPGKDHMLKIECFQRVSLATDPRFAPDPLLNGKDDAWRALLKACQRRIRTWIRTSTTSARNTFVVPCGIFYISLC